VVDRIHGEQGPARQVLLPTRLVQRGSGERSAARRATSRA
jgi:hypothetical protein